MTRGRWATLKLQQLRLDQENYRTGPQTTQRDAIRAMIDDQGKKLVRLAKDILEMKGTSPGEPLWVVPGAIRGQYIVEEGNRRVTALKLMETPALADGTALAKQFRALSKRYAEDPIRQLDARVFETREDVLPWKRRRHMSADSGIGLERWGTLGKGRANRDLGLAAPRSLAVVEYLQDETAEWNNISEALANRWTTVDRVLNAEKFRTLLGVTIDTKTGIISFENGDEKAGRALLLRVLNAMVSDEFEFSLVEHEEDREAFVTRFVDGSVKGVRTQGTPKDEAPTVPPSPPKDRPADTSPQDEQLQGLPAADPPSKPPKAEPPRDSLAPDKGPRLLPVNGPRLGPLYRECRKIRLRGNENAGALLLRVFIELSSEAYLKQKSVAFSPKMRSKNITTWEDHRVTLSDKIEQVARHIDPEGHSKALAQARLAIDKTTTGLSSIYTLHHYFHNLDMLPDASDLKTAWDGWESYLRELHTALAQP